MLGIDQDVWGGSNIGVFVALVGGVIVAVAGRGRIARQDRELAASHAAHNPLPDA